MSVLDSLYSMVARPVRAALETRRQVTRMNKKTPLDKDPQEKSLSSAFLSAAELSAADKQDSAQQAPAIQKPNLPRESVNKPLVERRARRSGSHIDIEV